MGKQAKNDVLNDDDDLELDGPEVEEHESEDDEHEDSPSTNEKSSKDDNDEDERVRVKDEDDEDDESEAAVLERRRQERKERKERKAEAIRRDKLELKFLRDRNDALERRLDGVEQGQRATQLTQIDGRIQQTVQTLRNAERVLAKAVEAKNGTDVATAMRLRDQATAELNQLNALKHQSSMAPSRPAGQQQVDPEIRRRAARFVDDHSWYDPKGGDVDSAIVLAIDSTLSRQGLDPSSSQYWTELRKQVRARLPHRFEDDEDREERRGSQERRPAGGPRIGAGRQQGQRTQETIKISAERKAALMEAGVWDDPKLRAKYLKRYQAYDKAHK